MHYFPLFLGGGGRAVRGLLGEGGKLIGVLGYRDGILVHQFSKRLESFASCSSQSLLIADFKENHTLL
jgi:hypothetical protein